MLTRTKKIAIATSTAALLVVGGTSFALGAASGGDTISACYATRTGDLRYVKTGTCAAGEKKLVWNIEGVKGARGAQGAKGAPGGTGTDGADGAVVSAQGVGFGGTAITTAGAVAVEAAITMPSAGNVVATAVGTLESTGGGTSSGACYFRIDGVAVGTSSAITTVGPGIIDAPLVNTSRIAVPAGESTVEWFCYRQSQDDSMLYHPTITLVATQ